MVLSCYVEIQQKATHERCTDVTGPSRPHSVMSSSMSRAASEAPGSRQNAGHYTTLHYTHHASSTIQLRYPIDPINIQFSQISKIYYRDLLNNLFVCNCFAYINQLSTMLCNEHTWISYPHRDITSRLSRNKWHHPLYYWQSVTDIHETTLILTH